ncbi:MULTISPECIES: HXXEE domain-containing protein [Actinosynnema]|uniref:HXXEE domain-containing protein n=1 Tax=Actinosynnema TaxID=40566 RepID=UPI0020A5E845|nr:HXXEE domain-containing protein [Actinosynnema pretiosum]
MITKSVTWGLLAAWVAHDLEELATMSSWSREHPAVPTVGRVESAVAIGAVGLVMAAAAADGARTGGRSRLFQAALTGFGLHAVTHVGASAVFRGYAPGVLTAPTVVAPYALWAWRRLRREGVWRGGSRAALAAFPLVVGGAHVLAKRVARGA